MEADSAAWRLLSTRTENWSQEEQIWLPTDSTALDYWPSNQRRVLERWQFLNERWRLFQRTQLSYTTTGQTAQSEDVTFTAQGDEEERQRVLYTYNANGQLILVQRQVQVQDAWATRVRVSYDYQEDGWRSVRNREVIDNGGIIGLERNEYTYYPQGWLREDRQRVLQGDSLVNEQRILWTYDAQGRLDSLQEERWMEGAWQPEGLSVYRYFRSDTLAVDTIVLAQWWQERWQPVLRTLERTNPLEPRTTSDELQQFAPGPGQWFGIQRTLRIYNPTLRQQISIFQRRLNDWENSSQTIRWYQENDLLYLTTEAFWTGETWESSERTFRFYERFSPLTKTEDRAIPDVKLFPNPVRDHLNIVWDAARATFTQVRLYDMQGRLHLVQEVPAHSSRLQLPPKLPSGTYVLELRNGKERGVWLIQRQ